MVPASSSPGCTGYQRLEGLAQGMRSRLLDRSVQLGAVQAPELSLLAA